jgi:pimeloyl-[acyl-carrier protein] methyl ester esterase
MGMTILCLSGWQQPANALSPLMPDAVHFDYSAYDNMRKMLAALPRAPHLAVGWSLGGQLLVRAIAEGYTKPEHLVLLAAPFQWVADAEFTQGIPLGAVEEVRGNYINDPEAMLKNLHALIALGDVKEKQIIRSLNAMLRLWENGMYWLDKLTYASCRRFDFSAFPPTTIVHGLKDKVIHPVNAEAYAEALPQAELQLWPECAHAPHLHDINALSDIVSRHV